MKLKHQLIPLIIFCGINSIANAGIVTQWGYDNQAGFTTWTGSAPGAVTASGDSASGSSNILSGGSYATTLSWGTPFPSGSVNQSNLDIESAVQGSMMTDGTYVNGTDVTHNNFFITGSSLSNASVLDGLSLVPQAWTLDGDETVLPTNNSPYLAPELTFGIDFIETPNNVSPCADGNLNNSGDNVNGCGDIFEITGLDLLGITPVVGADFIQFTVPFFLTTGDVAWDTTPYFVTTRLSGLTTLPDTYTCSGTSTCYGFVTKENNSNVLQSQFKIETATVPEPTTIGLFGLSLLVIGLSKKKYRS